MSVPSVMLPKLRFRAGSSKREARVGMMSRRIARTAEFLIWEKTRRDEMRLRRRTRGFTGGWDLGGDGHESVDVGSVKMVESSENW